MAKFQRDQNWAFEMDRCKSIFPDKQTMNQNSIRIAFESHTGDKTQSCFKCKKQMCVQYGRVVRNKPLMKMGLGAFV